MAETRDGRRKKGTEWISKEVELVEKESSRNYAMAVHPNAIAMAAIVWYGFAFDSEFAIDA